MLLPAKGDGGPGTGGLTAVETARAKVNLALHVTGQRADGYHLLDSLVVFPDIGDVVSISRETQGLTVTGPYAHALGGGGEDDNLVVRAAKLLAEATGRDPRSISLALEKILPVASGIGGGSADAAATLRLLRREWALDISDATVQQLALQLGADVPMCLLSEPARVSGIGENIELIRNMPACGILLVNPGVGVSTPEVFRALRRRDNPPLPGIPVAGFAEFDALLGWLSQTRNDLEPAATGLAPEIAEVLSMLEGQEEAAFARMSGSGATCFALTRHRAEAEELAGRIAASHPHWWAAAGKLS
ncbi:4-(cytidine 5'-diphospho)-2-C-methyl-D-erythritol kinase [Stappia sp. GBMRC 2046]|uniref:4-diphosphocytidyl-2-C-methyl-D-erythritol kinase n=1 Tax=Stappia sediminis TaxID=2692190 RepID=A0A7X3LRK7_9HYPH|nr:4-(cytidine 5'-diphospho)-2-C-methyl-D-erythritol kinase [Stappia sediminis]MXN63807.1 4-(cytidine 5'-diphospho)-2-C-methyl-D-erythritol kinase [Stappia sediminis]